MASKLYGVNATIIIFVFVLYCIVLYYIGSSVFACHSSKQPPTTTPSSKAEVQIIEHKTQQHKLLPLIALAYAFNFSVPVVEQCVEGAVGCVVGDAMGSGSIGSGVKGAMEDGSTRNAVRDNVESLRHSELQEAYSVSSCFKVLLAHKVSVAVQQCRLACGGCYGWVVGCFDG